jgi:hypothetical protein
MAGLFSYNCSGGPEQQFIAVGGIHVFERQASCKLTRVEPEGAVKDLEWVDTLALEAKSEGNAEITCGRERIILQIVAPARLEIKLVSHGKPADIQVNERFRAQALLYDRGGRALAVGKFTNLEWTPSGVFEIADDRSSGEFGFSDTAFGMRGFRAMKPGKGSIIARLGGLQGELIIEVDP